MRRTPVVVGLDLSLTATGVAVITPDGTPHVSTVRSVGHKGDTLAQRVTRLRAIQRAIRDQIDPHLWEGIARPLPAVIAVEAPAFSRTTGHMHDRSGLWWQVVSRLHAWPGIWDVVEIGPTSRAKYATGKGNASKDTVLAAVVRRYPTVPVANNNEADALTLAAMASRWAGLAIDDLPATHVAAMDAVHWPQEGQP